MMKNKERKSDLGSSIMELGRYVTQIFHFKDGEVRTFTGIDTTSIKDGQFCKMKRKNKSILSVNKKNLNCFEVFSEE